MAKDIRLSSRRLVENELYFRQKNERIIKGFDRIKKISAEEGEQFVIDEEKLALLFMCECADEKCRQRVKLSLAQYRKIHTNKRQFVIAKSHNVLAVEKVVDKQPRYWVVEKFVEPSKLVKK